MPNAAIALGNVESGEIVTATGVSNYANKNVGTNKQYTVNNIQLANWILFTVYCLFVPTFLLA